MYIFIWVHFAQTCTCENMRIGILEVDVMMFSALSTLFNQIFIAQCLCVFALLFVCALPLCLLPAEAKTGRQNSYVRDLLWGTKLNPCFLEE